MIGTYSRRDVLVTTGRLPKGGVFMSDQSQLLADPTTVPDSSPQAGGIREGTGTALSSTPVAEFQGYNSVTGRRLSTAVTGKASQRSAESTSRCTVCDDIFKLAKSLEIEQSLSIGFGARASVDQKMEFMQSLK